MGRNCRFYFLLGSVWDEIQYEPWAWQEMGVYCFRWKQQQSELLECYDLSPAYHKQSEVIGHRQGNITSVCHELYSAPRRQAPLYSPLRKKNDVLPRATFIFCVGVLCLFWGVMWSGKMDYKRWIRSPRVIRASLMYWMHHYFSFASTCRLIPRHLSPKWKGFFVPRHSHRQQFACLFNSSSFKCRLCYGKVPRCTCLVCF